MENDTFVNFFCRRQKTPQKILITLENHVGDYKKKQKQSKLFCLRSPVGRIVPKVIWSPVCSQNVWFLVKIEGALMKTK